jgi:hypothetical protein
MNSFPWFFASQKMRIILFWYLCHYGIFHYVISRVLLGLNIHILASFNEVYLLTCLLPLFLFSMCIFFLCPHAPSFLLRYSISYILSTFVYNISVRTSQETHYVSTTKPNRLMLFREIIAVYCENHTEHINKLRGQNIRIQFVPHRKHITSPLQSPTS